MESKFLNENLFRREAFYERNHFFVPGNYVVVMFRVIGIINPQCFQNAIFELRKCHPMIGVHIEFDENSKAWFVANNTLPCPLKSIPRQDDQTWLQAIYHEYTIPFDMTKGPLIRFLWIKGEQQSEIIAFAQHSICDGLSLVYLLRDLLFKLGNPESVLVPKTYLPTFREIYDLDSIKFNWFMKKIFTKFNTVWKKHQLRFTEDDFRPLHSAFLAQKLQILNFNLLPEITQKLVQRCRDEKVSVNSALYCAILNVQYQLQGDHDEFRKNIMMPINIRNYSSPPIGDGVGLFAGGETFPIKLNWKQRFWDQTRKIQKELQNRMSPKNVFTTAKKMLFLDPSLMEGRTFIFLGQLLPEPTLKYLELMHILEEDRMLSKLKTNLSKRSVQVGTILTNLGAINIPEKYGNLELEHIHLVPPVSPFAEKLIGVVTYKNLLQGSIAFTQKNLNPQFVSKFADTLVNMIKNSLM